MVVIGFTLLGVGLVVGLLLALADPVLLSRINGEPAQGGSGRHIEAPRVRAPQEAAGQATVSVTAPAAVPAAVPATGQATGQATVVRLADRARDDRPAPRAA
ncbi:hypothetical protein AB0C18_01570 [Nonomuraea muscovyensis]|uniref:hypothetical protein n=1 Tax=Nonomuraea muscovyensis TaxID=1124761 RepID=UPI00340CFA44